MKDEAANYFDRTIELLRSQRMERNDAVFLIIMGTEMTLTQISHYEVLLLLMNEKLLKN